MMERRGGEEPESECTSVLSHRHFDHVELALRRAAFRTNPIVRNLGPSRARRQSLIRVAFFLIIDVAAGPALPGFVGLGAHRDFPSCMEDLPDLAWASSGALRSHLIGWMHRRKLHSRARRAIARSKATKQYGVIPGWCVCTRPGISRFRVRYFVSPRNDGFRCFAEPDIRRAQGKKSPLGST
jgi:hypothetical protein